MDNTAYIRSDGRPHWTNVAFGDPLRLFGHGVELYRAWCSTPDHADRELGGVWADWIEENLDELDNRDAATRLLTYLRNRFNRI